MNTLQYPANAKPITLVAWRSGLSWTMWHIVGQKLGTTRCGLSVSGKIGVSHTPATANKWASVCEPCRALLLAGQP